MRRFRDLVLGFKEAGYGFSTFEEEPRQATVVLRHDIDFSLSAAVEIARVEHELGIRAHYFFLLTTAFYNLLSQEGKSAVRAISDLGHIASIHFDPTEHGDIDEGFEFEKRTFEQLFGGPITVVSLHRPRGFLENNNRPLPGVRHTYEDRFFRDMAYFSDSRDRFQHGHPLQSDAVKERRPIHLLIHPIWWVREAETPSGKLDAWLHERQQFLTEEMARNCDVYRRG